MNKETVLAKANYYKGVSDGYLELYQMMLQAEQEEAEEEAEEGEE